MVSGDGLTADGGEQDWQDNGGWQEGSELWQPTSTANGMNGQQAERLELCKCGRWATVGGQCIDCLLGEHRWWVNGETVRRADWWSADLAFLVEVGEARPVEGMVFHVEESGGREELARSLCWRVWGYEEGTEPDGVGPGDPTCEGAPEVMLLKQQPPERLVCPRCLELLKRRTRRAA